jgi:predicted RNA-binding Zn ribbon-like protein
MDVPRLSGWIESKVAPGPLIAVQALANSQPSEDQGELLLDVETTRYWLLRFGFGADGIVVTEDDRERLIELRRCVRVLIEANLTGEQDEAANERLAALAADHPVRVVVASDGSVGLDLAPVASVDALIAQLIGIVLRAQIDGTWERLKICAADTCRWAFYDASKNRRGHWCSMEVCGNREKNRSYRERQAAASTS